MNAERAVIRAMTEADVAGVADLYRQMYAEQKSFGMVMDFNGAEIESMLQAQLKSRLFIQYVAASGGKLQGFGIAALVRLPKKFALPSASSFIGFIHDLYVVPDMRGSGLADELLQALEQRMIAEGIDYVELHVLAGNERGKRFWAAREYRDTVQVMYKRLEGGNR